MNKSDLISRLNFDIQNEYAHMHFYMHSAAMVEGLHRQELREFFMEQATSEMKHIQAFADMIVGLGGKPNCLPSSFPDHMSSPNDILEYALRMETEVVNNYAERMDQAASLGGADGKWVEAFLENQIIDSRTDADNIRMMRK